MLDCTAPTLLVDFPLLAVKKMHPCFGFSFSVSVAHPSYCCATVKIHLLTPTAPSGSWCDSGKAQLMHQSCLTKHPIRESRVPGLCSATPADRHSQRFRPSFLGGHHKPLCPHAGKTPVQGRVLMGKSKIYPWEILKLQNLAGT